VTRRDDQRLRDILASVGAIRGHLERGGLDDGLVFDAVRVRLIEIGEGVRAIDPQLLAREASIPWADVAGMRNHLAHRYFDTAQAIVHATIDTDLPPLIAAVERLLGSILRAQESNGAPASQAFGLPGLVTSGRLSGTFPDDGGDRTP
jgi:uncharacterized protein with HEPN domain